MGKIAVVGAGAAGMTAAGFAARRGFAVSLIERNERPGRKLMITGKGRCNVTNDCEIDEFMSNVPEGGRFLYSSLSAFGPWETMAFFEGLGVPLKVERGKRVFPVSDRASDIVDALAGFVKEAGCVRITGRAAGLVTQNGRVTGVRLEDGKIVAADAVIICTGGLSYPLTGSTGDGYALAKGAGHTVEPLRPSLVPLETVESWPASLQGLTLKNVTLRVGDKKRGGAAVYEELGEMLFTHFGVTGPLVLSASAHMRQMEPGRYRCGIDLKPGLNEAQLDARLQRDFLKFSNHDFINALGDLLPSKLIPVMVSLTGIDPHLKANQLTKEMRRGLTALFKNISFDIRGFRPIEEAVVTSGGVKTGEVNPKTMESKLIKNLHFAGEILDVDAYTGGFNLQIAFSTGYAAGNGALNV
jgi:predicted Rossmann fold flavoprotein